MSGPAAETGSGAPEILIIDDVAEDAERLRVALRAALPRAVLRTARSVDDGLSRLREREPALVILDLMLPGLSGFQGLMAIRATWPDLPVLIFTSVAEDGPRFLCRELGADYYQVKPPAVRYARFAAFVAERLRDGGFAALRSGAWEDRCGALA